MFGFGNAARQAAPYGGQDAALPPNLSKRMEAVAAVWACDPKGGRRRAKWERPCKAQASSQEVGGSKLAVCREVEGLPGTAR